VTPTEEECEGVSKRCLDSGEEARVMNAQECLGRHNQDRCGFVT
jgi:hypothetical protein